MALWTWVLFFVPLLFRFANGLERPEASEDELVSGSRIIPISLEESHFGEISDGFSVYYRFHSSEPRNVRIRLIPCFGDPNLYITNEAEKRGVPGVTHFSFYSSRPNENEDFVDLYGAYGSYLIAVHSLNPSKFELFIENYDGKSLSILKQRKEKWKYELNITSIYHQTASIAWFGTEPGTYMLYALRKEGQTGYVEHACGVQSDMHAISKKVVIYDAKSQETVCDADGDCSFPRTNQYASAKRRRISTLSGLNSGEKYVFNIVYTPFGENSKSRAFYAVQSVVEDVDEMEIGGRRNLEVGEAQYQYFSFRLKEKDRQSVNIRLRSLTEDCDLYVNQRTLPSYLQYTSASVTPGLDSVTIPDAVGTYFIAVYGAKRSECVLELTSDQYDEGTGWAEYEHRNDQEPELGEDNFDFFSLLFDVFVEIIEGLS